ncbi:MAG: AI-2E family transporter [Bdellovibrionales bacterium]|nr:AI-2E family transporter [Bdellovibrionales bacterium]
MNHTHERRLRRIILYTVSLLFGSIAFIFFFWSLRALFMPLITGALLAYLFKPLVYSIKIKWLPENLKILLILGLIVFSLGLFAREIKNNLPDKFQRYELAIRAQYKFNDRWAKIMGINQETGKGNFVYNLISSDVSPVIEKINHALFLNPQEESEYLSLFENRGENDLSEKFYQYYLANKARIKHTQSIKKEAQTEIKSNPDKEEHESLISKLFTIFSNWLLMPFVFLFLLFDKGEILRFFIKLIPNRYFEMSLMVINEVDEAIGNYLRGTLLECSLVALTFSIGLYLIGIELGLSIIIGLIAGLTNAIPFLGPAIGFVVGTSYALIVENIDPIIPFMTTDNLFIGVIAVVGIAQLLDNVIFQPIVLGSAVNLHPLVVIIGVMGGSIIFGFSGMLLAIPFIVITKVIIETAFKELKAYKII